MARKQNARKRLDVAGHPRDGTEDFDHRRMRIATLTITLAIKEPSTPGLHPGQRLTSQLARLAMNEYFSQLEDHTMVTLYGGKESTNLAVHLLDDPFKITARKPRGKEKRIWW